MNILADQTFQYVYDRGAYLAAEARQDEAAVELPDDRHLAEVRLATRESPQWQQDHRVHPRGMASDGSQRCCRVAAPPLN